MGIISASQAVKNARSQAGWSQSQLADGICSVIALSNFETGKYGISPSTFSLLMSKMGTPCEEYPLFENMNDYECFKHLIAAKSYIDYSKTELALSELEQPVLKNFNHNKFYYQNWLYLYAYILILDEKQDSELIINTLKEAVGLTQPNFDLSDITPSRYNTIEKNLILFIGFFSMIKKAQLSLCADILRKLEGSHTDNPDTNLLYTFISGIYFYKLQDFTKAFIFSKNLQLLSLETGIHTFLIPAVFLMGICGRREYLLNGRALHEQSPLLTDHIAMIYASLETADVYSPLLGKYLQEHFDLSDIDILSSYQQNKKFPILRSLPLQLPTDLRDGSFDIYADSVVSLGAIIGSLRKEQALSQQTLCNGLCNKSTLSKFEKGLLTPNVLVSQYLLERLGTSSKEFVFYGSQTEADFYKIKETLSGHYKMNREQYRSYTEQLAPLAESNPLIKQQYYLFMTQLTEDKTEVIDLCNKALKITLPDFDIGNITHYRLSWAEMTLITVMVNAIAFSENHFDAPYYFQQIYQYMTNQNFELLWKKNHLAPTLSKYVRYLGENKMYKILLARMEQWDFSCCNFHFGNMLNINYYLSQAYMSAGEKEKAEKCSCLVASLAVLLNDSRALDHLSEGFFKE